MLAGTAADTATDRTSFGVSRRRRSRSTARVSASASCRRCSRKRGVKERERRAGSFTAFAPLAPAVARPGSSAPCACRADLAPEDAPECLHGHPQHAPSGRGYKLRRTAFSILRARHDQTTSERRDRLGGLIHEYSLAA